MELVSLINGKMQFEASDLLFTLQLSSSKGIHIQLLLIAPVSLLSLCRRFYFYFVKIVKPKTILKPKDPSSSVCLPVGG